LGKGVNLIDFAVLENTLNICDIQCDIEGPVQTPFHEGLFRVRLEFPVDFPNSPPKGYFLTKIYHPNIAENGEICVNSLKKDWDPLNWSLRNIFEVINK
jgi:ubiquitin-conjugating enzyme E2 S